VQPLDILLYILYDAAMKTQEVFNLRLERNKPLALVTQHDLAQEMGWTRQLIVDIEAGRVVPTPENQNLLLEAIRRISERAGGA
jgi:DNA-binding XRE family transcriptional regulator